jgi:hypothetical protein
LRLSAQEAAHDVPDLGIATPESAVRVGAIPRRFAIANGWPLKVLALVFDDQSIKLLAALCVAKDLVRGHAYS